MQVFKLLSLYLLNWSVSVDSFIQFIISIIRNTIIPKLYPPKFVLRSSVFSNCIIVLLQAIAELAVQLNWDYAAISSDEDQKELNSSLAEHLACQRVCRIEKSVSDNKEGKNRPRATIVLQSLAEEKSELRYRTF